MADRVFDSVAAWVCNHTSNDPAGTVTAFSQPCNDRSSAS